jgi:serine-type D-Ala-D-Ala carboxypeptidase (penicillin-binding protein 5/6)
VNGRRRLLAAAWAAAGVLALAAAQVHASAASAASAASGPPPPTVAAPSALVIDAQTGETLFARHEHAERQIASTTKLMTALLALERAKPGDVFTAPEYHPLNAESVIHLSAGEHMTVSDLLRALLLESANDAAVTVAENVAGSRSAFVREMNDEARGLKLNETHFANPIGLDDPDNYSSAHDLAALTRHLLRRPRFARTVALPSATLESGDHVRTIDNRNDLVQRYAFVTGVKTGHTHGAGHVLVGSARRRGAKVITVVMGESSEAYRDTDTLSLMRYGLGQFKRVKPVRAGEVLARARVDYRSGNVALKAAYSAALTVRRGEHARVVVRAPHELRGPLPKGHRVGSARIYYRGHRLRTVPLVTARTVPGAGFFRRTVSGLGVPLTLVLALAIVSAAALAGLRARAIRKRREKSRARAAARSR